MSTNITANDLQKIFSRWDKDDTPNDAKDKAIEYSLKVVDKIFDLISLLGSYDTNTSYELGQMVGEITGPSFILCYYIGYELASGKMRRENGSPYLSAATQPIADFVLQIVAQIVMKDITKKEAVQTSALEIARLTGEVSSDICILGIKNFSTT